MERVSLREAFHGEPDKTQEGTAVEGKGPDQVTVNVKGGRLILRVPNDVQDNDVIAKEFMDQFLQLILELEDGSELTVLVDDSDNLADVAPHSGRRAGAQKVTVKPPCEPLSI